MIRSILVPYDGSSFSEAALPLALELSRRTEATLTLVTVIEGVTEFAFPEWEERAQTGARQTLEDIVERIDPLTNADIDYIVVHGEAADTIASVARNERIDLVVMATHGRGAVSRAWLGSVADRFSRSTPVPTLLVRPVGDDTPVTHFGHDFETLLIPLDGSELSEEALQHATAFGELFDSAYHLTRVVSYPVDLTSPYLPQTATISQSVVDESKRCAAEYLERHADRMRRRGLRVTTSVCVDAQPGRGILSEAEAVGAELVAMATHGHTGLRRWVLGSATDKVVRGAHVPVLLHRPPHVD
ncbi:MAG: universal stress protein [Gemmatimonadota bacterium]